MEDLEPFLFMKTWQICLSVLSHFSRLVEKSFKS